MLMHFTAVRSQQDTSQLPCPAMPNGESATSTSLNPTATNSVSLGLCCPRSNSHLWCGRSIRGLVEPPAVFSTFRSRFKPLAGSRRRATYFQELAQPNLHVQPIRLSNLSLPWASPIRQPWRRCSRRRTCRAFQQSSKPYEERDHVQRFSVQCFRSVL